MKDIDLSRLEIKEIITLYSKILIELKSREVIRSKNFVGDLGEYLVIDFFNRSKNLSNLSFSPPSNESYDAIDNNGKKYAIKTTTSKTTGVFYGLKPKNSTYKDNKIFDYAIILKLNDNYEMEKIVMLNWDEFIVFKKWHSRMKAWNLNLSKKMESNITLIFEKEK